MVSPLTGDREDERTLYVKEFFGPSLCSIPSLSFSVYACKIGCSLVLQPWPEMIGFRVRRMQAFLVGGRLGGERRPLGHQKNTLQIVLIDSTSPAYSRRFFTSRARRPFLKQIVHTVVVPRCGGVGLGDVL